MHATWKLNYYPFGSKRIENGTDMSQREFIGEHFDEETDLSYLNARYYENARGQFLGQDPVFWEVGVTDDGRSVLTNPQLQNSYGYGANNPVRFSDPTGRFWRYGFYDWRGYNGFSGVMMKLGEVFGGRPSRSRCTSMERCTSEGKMYIKGNMYIRGKMYIFGERCISGKKIYIRDRKLGHQGN